MKFKILIIAGARPNFMKIAPIIREMKSYPARVTPLMAHTGQHFDHHMSGLFFENLKIPRPDYYLGVGSGSHVRQTACVMARLEKVLLKAMPHLVLVVGDVNSTASAALCAAKLGIPVAHVEAGLRSFDRTMPEEINRVLTDSIADYLFITEKSARMNLLKEGRKDRDIYFTGNVMIDTLINSRKEADKSDILERLKLRKRDYAVLTLHRPGNVDAKEAFISVLESIREAQRYIRVVWPVHPRSKKMMEEFGLGGYLSGMPNLKLMPAAGYMDFLKLMTDSRLVLTDSGGIQEETTFLGIPCLTLRNNTERPVTVEQGTNVVTGCDRKKIAREIRMVFSGNFKKGKVPLLWDGKAASRIVKILIRELGKRYGPR